MHLVPSRQSTRLARASVPTPTAAPATNLASSTPAPDGLSRRSFGRLAVGAALAFAGVGCLDCLGARTALAESTKGSAKALNSPMRDAMLVSRDASSAADARRTASSSADKDSTVRSNSTRRFADIPADALMSVDELHDLAESGAIEDGTVTVIDIRSHRDYQKDQIEGSRNIPAGRQIEIRIDEIPTDEEVVLIAYKNSDRLAETWYTLQDHGFDMSLVRVLDGGVYAWMQAGYPVLENQFLGC